MKNNKYGTTPLVELFSNMAYLERDIDLEIMKGNKETKVCKAKISVYEEMRDEVIKRFPPMEEAIRTFKEEKGKEKVYGK